MKEVFGIGLFQVHEIAKYFFISYEGFHTLCVKMVTPQITPIFNPKLLY